MKQKSTILAKKRFNAFITFVRTRFGFFVRKSLYQKYVDYLVSLGFQEIEYTTPESVAHTFIVLRKPIGNNFLQVTISVFRKMVKVSYDYVYSEDNRYFVFAHRYIVDNLDQLKFLILKCSRTYRDFD